MVQILANNKPLQLLQPVDTELISLDITVVPSFQRQMVPKAQSNAIKEWIYNLSQSVTNCLTYNGVIITLDSVNKPTHMENL
jgi:hypothetical protein